jgi:hypothetical protein
MSQTRKLSLLAGAVATTGAFGNAYAAEGQSQSFTNADEVRAIVSEMLADAETRSSLQAGGTGGWDDGFFLQDSGGNFRLNVGGLVQFRYNLNFRDDGDSDDGEDEVFGLDGNDFESGYQTSRTKLDFNGHIINPNLFYNVKIASFAPDSGDFNIQHAYVGYLWDNGFHAKWGQYRIQFAREKNIGDRYQLVADRSVTGEVFDQGDSQGMEMGYKAEDWRVITSFSDGFNTANTDYDSTTAIGAAYDPDTGDLVASSPLIGSQFTGEADIAFTARGEIKFAGAWEQAEDFTSMPGSEFFAMFGVAAHIQWSDEDRVAVSGGGTAGDVLYWAWTADISLEGDGWNFFVAGYGGYTNFSDVTQNLTTGDEDDVDTDDYGVIVQGGIFIPETDWEFFARYDATFIDDDEREIGNDNDVFNVATVGVNWYWAGHAAKFTFDVQYFIDDFNALSGRNTLTGYLGSPDDGEVNIRFQFQLIF